MKHPGYEPFCSFEYKQASHFLRSIFSKEKYWQFEEMVISERTIENLPHLSRLSTISSCIGVFKGEKAVIASPGPSLERALPFLKKQKEAFVFAALQALPLLQKNGVCVDFVVIADPGDLTKFQKKCQLGEETLLVDSCVDPTVLCWAPDQTKVFNLYSDQLHQLLWANLPSVSIDESVSTVSEVSAILAKLFGFEEFVFLGMDFCWQKERYSYRPIGAQEKPEIRFCLRAKGGLIAETYADYYHAFRFMDQYCGHLQNEGIKVSQYTEGMALGHAKQLEVEDFEGLWEGGRGKKGKRELLPISCENFLKKAQSLLLRARDSTHLKGRNPDENVSNKFGGGMSFLDEVALDKRKKLCEESLLELRRKI